MIDDRRSTINSDGSPSLTVRDPCHDNINIVHWVRCTPRRTASKLTVHLDCTRQVMCAARASRALVCTVCGVRPIALPENLFLDLGSDLDHGQSVTLCRSLSLDMQPHQLPAQNFAGVYSRISSISSEEQLTVHLDCTIADCKADC
jgi:hypothetical protein